MKINVINIYRIGPIRNFKSKKIGIAQYNYINYLFIDIKLLLESFCKFGPNYIAYMKRINL